MTQATPADTLQKGAWWRAYGDPTLDGLEARIESANPSLAEAVARYDQARALAGVAAAAQYPTLTAVAAPTANRQSTSWLRGRPATDPTTMTPTASAACSAMRSMWGRVRNLVQAGKAKVQASAADLETVRLSLEAEAGHRLCPATRA